MKIEHEFKWSRARNESDYEVIDGRKPGQSLLDSTTTRIVMASGAAVDWYQPLAIPNLWTQFAKIQTAKEAERFVRKFGPLTQRARLPRTDVIELIIIHAHDMKEAIGTAATFWAKQPLAKLSLRIVAGQLKISPNTLLDAIWLQFAEAETAGRAKLCPQCDKPFEAGPGQKRRGNAKFCSRECDVKFHSLERSRLP